MVVPDGAGPPPADTPTRTRRLGGKGPAKAASPRRVAGAARRPTHKIDIRKSVRGLIQLAAAPLAMLGRRNPVYLVDAATLTMHAAPLADALKETADADERFAAVLERVLAAGPYAALIGAVVSVGVQLAHNHSMIPAELATAMGAADPQRILDDFLRQAQEAAEAAAADSMPAAA